MPHPKLIVLVLGLALATACSAPPSHAYTTQGAPARPPSPTSTLPEVVAAQAPGVGGPEAPIVITGAGFDVHTAGKVSQATFDATWSGVLATLNRYLEVAVLTPLRTGGPAGDLRPLFTSLSVNQVLALGGDRSAFIDEGLAPATDLHEDAGVATLAALAGADGTMSVVTANLDLRLSGHVGGAPMFLERTGELVLMPDGGAWRIDAWNLKVTRRLAQTTTSTTATSTTAGS